MDFKSFCEQLEHKIKNAYTEDITMNQAEKLSGEFLYAQMQVSSQLRKADLDSRMRKSGIKAIRAVLYMEACEKHEKKPTEAYLNSLIDSNEMVIGEQKSFDEAEVEKSDLERYYDIFGQAHVYFRQIAKGNMG